MWNGGTAPHILYQDTLKVPDCCHGPAVTTAQIIPGIRANPNTAENSIKASAGNRTHVHWSYRTGHSDGTTGLRATGLVMCAEFS